MFLLSEGVNLLVGNSTCNPVVFTCIPVENKVEVVC